MSFPAPTVRATTTGLMAAALLASAMLSACASALADRAGASEPAAAPAGRATPASFAPTRASVSPAFCDRPADKDATEQSQVLQFAELIRRELQDSGTPAALLSRSGLNLDRFDIRYSHAGIALRDGTDVPWSVRQLYYACDEGKPRIFDQGIAGYLFNADTAQAGFVSVVLLPEPAGRQLHDAALDTGRALGLLSSRYSANAYPFSTQYQNCNQWVAEMMALAWRDGAPPREHRGAPFAPANTAAPSLRASAQRWLAQNGYAPAYVPVHSQWVMWAGSFAPLVHFDDHPDDERYDHRYRLSLPDSLERFVRQQVPGARRIEFCRTARYMVVHEGWTPLPRTCEPAAGDRVIDVA